MNTPSGTQVLGYSEEDIAAARRRARAARRPSRAKRPVIDARTLRVVGYMDRHGNPQPLPPKKGA